MALNNKPIELRLKRLEEALSKQPKKQSALSWLADPARAISFTALLISLTTTIYTWRKDTLQSEEAQRRRLDSAIEQLIDNGLKNYEYREKNKGAENFGLMNSWFTSQALIMRDKAANSMLGLDDVTAGQYLLVGNAMVAAGQPNRASFLFRKAIEVLQTKKRYDASYFEKLKQMIGFGLPADEDPFDIASVTDLASAYTSLGSSLTNAGNYEEGAREFENALKIYKDSSKFPVAAKDESYAYVHKFWAESLARVYQCAQAKDHFYAALNLFPQARKNFQDTDFTSIQYGLNWSTQCLAAPPNVPSPPIKLAPQAPK
jgi:tetratricopeptide (TPR) repeat protein